MEKLLLAIIDDEDEILKSLKRLFRHDYQVMTFESGEQFLTFARAYPVDIVLSDIRMPHMDGFKLMEHIRDMQPDAVRLCISGYADMERCQAAIEEGLFEYIIPKPWENFELKCILRVFAENKQLKQKLADSQNETGQEG